METMIVKMQQESQVHWRYKWTVKRKVKWRIKNLLARRNQQILRRWLREVENLIDTEDRVVYICELEVGESLSDEERI
jgi:hypothetical protein